MHQQPPKTPLLRSTTSAKASQVEASSGRTQYTICSVTDSSIEAVRLATGPAGGAKGTLTPDPLLAKVVRLEVWPALILLAAGFE